MIFNLFIFFLPFWLEIFFSISAIERIAVLLILCISILLIIIIIIESNILEAELFSPKETLCR